MSKASLARITTLLLTLAATHGVAVAHGWNPNRATFPSARFDHAASFDYFQGTLVVFGGDSGVALLDDTWLLSGGVWTAGPAAPPALTPRSRHAMAFLAQGGGTHVLFGGIDGQGPKNDTWEFDGTQWIQGLPTPPGLTARGNHAMAYNANLGLVVLFGGWNGTYFNDTWDYNGLTWQLGASAPAGLTPRDSHAMTWDPAQSRIVLFGGWDGASALSDTWFDDGIAWTQGPAAPPALTARYSMALAAEPGIAGLVVFGGTPDGTTLLGDTWLLEAGTWSAGPAAPAGLTPRVDATLTAVTGSPAAILVGGQDAAGASAGTWDYVDGDDYLLGAGSGAPNPNRVRIFNSGGVATSFDTLAYAGGQWGVNVAGGAMASPVREDVVTGPGPGAVYGPQVRGFRKDGSVFAKINFYAYGTLKFGTNVTCQDTDTDAYDELVTGAGPGAVFGPHVRGWNFDAASISPISKINFFAYATLKFGVNVSGGDLDGDGFDELLTGAGPSPVFAPTVRGWNVDGGGVTSIAKINYNAFVTAGYGTNVAGGLVDADAFAEIAAAKGPGPLHAADFVGHDFDNTAIAALPGFAITAYTTHFGGRVGSGDIGAEPFDDLVCGPGPDPAATATVRTFSYAGGFLFDFANTFDAFPPTTFYGVNVATGDFGL